MERQTDCICREKTKTFMFLKTASLADTLFSDKNSLFFGRKKLFLPHKIRTCFFEKNVFFGNVFGKNFKKIFHIFFMGRKRFESLKKNFQKHLFSKKKGEWFFHKKKVLCFVGQTKFFLQKRIIFV